jgi:PAS domain-containing protein
LGGTASAALRWGLAAAVVAGVAGLVQAALATARQAATAVLEAQRLHADNARQLHAAAHAKDQSRSVEQRFRELVDGVGGIVWEARPPTFRFSFVSQSAEKILGIPVRRWLEDPGFWPGVVHPDDREAALALRREAVTRGEEHRCDTGRWRRTGERSGWTTARTWCATPRASRSSCAGSWWTSPSAARRRTTCAARRPASVPSSTPPWTRSSAWTSAGWWPLGTHRAEEIFGWTREEALGRKLAELIIPPGLREEHARGLDRFLAGGDAPLLGRRWRCGA